MCSGIGDGLPLQEIPGREALIRRAGRFVRVRPEPAIRSRPLDFRLADVLLTVCDPISSIRLSVCQQRLFQAVRSQPRSVAPAGPVGGGFETSANTQGAALSGALREPLCHWIPVVHSPSVGETRPLAVRKSAMVEH
jgi:hypothetical protein